MDTKVADKLNKFFSKYSFLKFKKGDILISPNSLPPGIFYLREGVVKQYGISLNGEELILNIYKSNSLFPMSYVINNSPPQHYFEAMTPLLVGRASKDVFLKFVKKNDDILFDLVSRIYKGLEGYFLKMEYLLAGRAKKRLITELLIYAKRFGEKKGNTISINLKITEKDLASQSGIARETVSREIQKIKGKKLLSFQRGFLIIYDLQKLEEELLL